MAPGLSPATTRGYTRKFPRPLVIMPPLPVDRQDYVKYLDIDDDDDDDDDGDGSVYAESDAAIGISSADDQSEDLELDEDLSTPRHSQPTSRKKGTATRKGQDPQKLRAKPSKREIQPHQYIQGGYGLLKSERTTKRKSRTWSPPNRSASSKKVKSVKNIPKSRRAEAASKKSRRTLDSPVGNDVDDHRPSPSLVRHSSSPPCVSPTVNAGKVLGDHIEELCIEAVEENQVMQWTYDDFGDSLEDELLRLMRLSVFVEVCGRFQAKRSPNPARWRLEETCLNVVKDSELDPTGQREQLIKMDLIPKFKHVVTKVTDKVMDRLAHRYLDPDKKALMQQTPKKSLRRGPPSPKAHTDGEEPIEHGTDSEHLAEDSNNWTQSQPRSTRKKPLSSAQEKKLRALEKLRAKQTGFDIFMSDSPDISSDEDLERPLYDTSSDSNTPGTRPCNRPRRWKMKDFIKEGKDDDSETVRMEMPAQFSQVVQKTRKNHFEQAAQWIIECIMNPEQAQADWESSTSVKSEVKAAFEAIDRWLAGFRDSVYATDSWKVSKYFLPTLEFRPYTHEERLDAKDANQTHCEACQRRNAPASWTMSFAGNPYERESLEFFDPEYLGTVSDDEQRLDEIADQGRKFYLGKFCFGKAQIRHKLLHWKLTLYESIRQKLRSRDFLSDASQAAFDALGVGAKVDRVNQVMDLLQREKLLKKMWRSFNSFVEEHKTTTKLAEIGVVGTFG